MEKTLFRWTDSGEKTVGLMSRLREGCVVFVRLIHAFAENANFPVAYRVQLLIEVCGFDSCLRFFTERTETRNVSGWGCQFPLRIEVSEEAVLAIRVIRQNGDSESASKSALFRIVRVRPGPEGILVQAQKMQPYDIWNTEIPLLN